jgi:membrane-associated PAP2 superfamily phosphatase
MFDFLSGMDAAGFLVAALFFFRFWHRTKDSLFANFGIAFMLFGMSQVISLAFDTPHDDKIWVYLLRLTAFMLLLVAIVSKNLKRPNL